MSINLQWCCDLHFDWYYHVKYMPWPDNLSQCSWSLLGPETVKPIWQFSCVFTAANIMLLRAEYFLLISLLTQVFAFHTLDGIWLVTCFDSSVFVNSSSPFIDKCILNLFLYLYFVCLSSTGQAFLPVCEIVSSDIFVNYNYSFDERPVQVLSGKCTVHVDSRDNLFMPQTWYLFLM